MEGWRNGQGTWHVRADVAQLGQGGRGRQTTGAGSKTVTPEQMELSRLRAENARLKRDMEIVKKAATYFAKEVL